MHILLGILKIAGMILLIILGLLLLILMIVLFTPVTYRGRITTGGDITVTRDPDRLYILVEAAWLVKLVHVSIELREKKIRLIGKAAGKTIVQKGDQDGPEDSKSGTPVQPDEPGPDVPQPKAPEAETVQEKAPEAEAVQEKTPDTETVQAAAPEAVQQPEPEKPEPGSEEAASPSSWFYETPAQESEGRGESTGGESASEDAAVSGAGADPAPVRWIRKMIDRLKTPGVEKDRQKDTEDGLVTRLYQKVADLLFDLLDLVDTRVDELDRKVEGICAKLRGINPLTDWVSRGYYGWVLYKALKMIAHFGVRKMRGHIRLGIGSPHLTAIAGGALYSWLPVDEVTKADEEPETSAAKDEVLLVPTRDLPGELTEKKMTLEADFYRLKLDADTDFRGHIRLCHAGWLVLQAVAKRDTWMMLKKIKNRRR